MVYYKTHEKRIFADILLGVNMTHIVCDKCKNADLVFENDELLCPSCGAVFSADDENLLLGITLYRENKTEECESALMKALVKDGSSSKALIYKALADTLSVDEDTVSFSDIYSRIISALETADDCDFSELLLVSNDEMAKHERALTELHVKAFETADAEKIKKEVEFLLRIRDEALAFRSSLTELAESFNKKGLGTVTLNLSRCFYVSYEQADEVGDKKLNKIKEDVASHTVFTGILSSDIKNLEIYYRCVVMFFEKSKAKYDFLISNAKKLAYLNGALESGKYATVASPAVAAEKLKAAAYGFFEESLKEYDDENENMPSVVFTPPVIEEEAAKEEETVQEETAAENVADITNEDTPATDTEVTNNSESSDEASDEERISEEASTEDEPEAPSNEETEEEKSEEAEEEKDEDGASNEANEASSENGEAPESEKASENEDVLNQSEAEEESRESEPSEEIAEAVPSDSEIKEAIESTVQKVMEEINAESEKAVTELSEISGDITSNSLADSKNHREYKAPECSTEPVSSPDAIIELPKEEEEPSPDETDKAAAADTKADESSALSEEKSEEYETTLKPKKKNRHIGLIMLLIIAVAVLSGLCFKYVPGIITEAKYKSAVKLLEEGSYSQAHEAFKKLGDYEDSADKVLESDYLAAEKLAENGEYSAAAQAFEALGEYKDAVTRTLSCKYEAALKTLNDGNFDDAARLFEEIKDYGNSADMITECTYKKAEALLEGKSYTDAAELFASLEGYSDSADKAKEAKYQYVTENLSKDDKTTVAYITELAKLKYRNSAELKTKLLGEDTSDSVKVFVNTSATDLSSSLKSASHTTGLYFHIVAGEEFFGKSITLSYTTQYGYTQSSTVTLSKNNSDDYITYPASNVTNYKVTFTAYDESGASLGKVDFTVE